MFLYFFCYNNYMVTYNCCYNMRILRDSNYVDGELLYLQRPSVRTNLPFFLMNYSNCLSCGEPLSTHPDDGNSRCLTFRNGLLLHKTVPRRRFDRRADRNQYMFNLVTRREFHEFREGDPNFPEPISVNFCPYCGCQHLGDFNWIPTLYNRY
jgi:hypothetical protein